MRVSLILALLTSVAAAKPRPEAEQAQDAAYQAYGVSDYDTAIAEYKRAYRLTGDPRLFYNLGLAHRKRHQLRGARADAVEARDYFHRFVELLDPDDAARAGERDRLERMRSLARTYITELERELAKPPPAPPPPPPPPKQPPPKQPPPAPEPDEPEPDEPEPAPELAPAPPSRRLTTALLISAGALVVAGGATGVLALHHQREAEAAATGGDVIGAGASGERADRFALATDVLLGAAVITGGVALYLALVRPASRIQVTASPRGAALVVRY